MSILYFRSGTPGTLRLVLVNALVPSAHHAVQEVWAVQHALPGGDDIEARCEEVRDDLCRFREILMAEVASEGRW